jgi:pimeloyl-ACP methyl ester carboxylesterase
MRECYSICLKIVLFFVFLQKVFAQEPLGLVEHLWETQDEQNRRLEELKDAFSIHKKLIRAVGTDTTLNLESMRIRLDGKIQSESADVCGSDKCFDFYYFNGENFDTQNDARKNVLYVSGGPGKVSTFDDRALGRFEGEYNVVYFHLRGSGLSALPPSNKYDRFLRTKYAIEDIEQLRKKILRTSSGSTRPWDAIVGYSYGTVLAQQYAKKYPGNVKQLILHAPIYRNNDTDKARSKQLLSNLRKIYTLVRSNDSIACSCRPIKPQNMKIKATEEVSAADNFCYLDSDSNDRLIDTVSRRIVTEYDKIIYDVGAIGFVTEDYETFKKIYDPIYPDEFYYALRKLTLMGSPEDEKSSLSAGSIERMVDAAIVLGYYASLDDAKLFKMRENHSSECSVRDKFFEHAPANTCQHISYCDRLKAAREGVVRQEPRSEPARALYVFGILDGLQHWIPRVLRAEGIEVEDESCPTGDNLIRFARSSGEGHRLLHEIGRKIGVAPGDEYCAWDPARFKHSVQTIVVTGTADVVTAGCEAENFFDRGLSKGQRVIIEFPTMGHEDPIPRELVPKILAKPTLEGIQAAIKEDLINLRASNHTPRDGGQLSCRPTE